MRLSLGTLQRGVLALLALGGLSVYAQSPIEPPASPALKPKDEAVDKRILGVLPNYRTANLSAEYHPLSTRRKFYIGYKDSTDYPVFFIAAAFAGIYQAEDSHPSFGQGMKGYAHRYVTSYADQAIGNLMAESLMPSLLHEDPRYFRVGSGSKKYRLGYALTRIFVVRTDKGGRRFNFSEVFGNAINAGIGNAYYRDERKLADNAQRLYTSLSTDAFSQVLKEFWPDVKRRLTRQSAH